MFDDDNSTAPRSSWFHKNQPTKTFIPIATPQQPHPERPEAMKLWRRQYEPGWKPKV
jgi:hypothetical protein